MFERYLELLKEKGVRNIDVARVTGIPASTFSDWKKGKSKPKTDKLQKIADYFGVSLDWLTGVSEYRTSQESALTKRDERDIAKRLDDTLRDLEEKQEALMFYGEPLDDETKELLIASLERSMRVAKAEAKERFTPKKYKKDTK